MPLPSCPHCPPGVRAGKHPPGRAGPLFVGAAKRGQRGRGHPAAGAALPGRAEIGWARAPAFCTNSMEKSCKLCQIFFIAQNMLEISFQLRYNVTHE